MSTKKHQNLCHPVKHLKQVSHHYHLLMNPSGGAQLFWGAGLTGELDGVSLIGRGGGG